MTDNNNSEKYSPWTDDSEQEGFFDDTRITSRESDTSLSTTHIPGNDFQLTFEIENDVELAALNEIVKAANPRSTQPNFLEMRHVAGLAAGTVLGLPEGSFQFKKPSGELLFLLNVSDGIATVKPGDETIWADETPIKRPLSLSRSVLNTGSSRFIIRPPRSGYGEYSQPGEMSAQETIEVPNFKRTSKDTWQFGKASMGPTINLDSASWEFIESIRSARDEDTRVQRQLHPDPEELSYRAYNKGFGLLQRDSDHQFYTRFSIAHGAIPWRPRFNKPDEIPKKLHANIDQLCSLASVPITANLQKGPLAIVGSRDTRLAAARHAIISIAALSKPGSVELKVITTDKNQNDSWMWLSELPYWASASENSERVLIADGMRSFDLAGLDHGQAERNEMNLIILAESVKEVPAYCSVILQVGDSGVCKATNRSGESVNGTAIGISEGFAGAMGRKLKELHT